MYSSEHKDLSLIERIRAVGIYEQLESPTKLSWEEFEKRFLLSIRIHKLYSQLFIYFQGFQNIRTRDLLVAYSIIYYEMDDTESGRNVKEAATNLIHALHKEPLDSVTFRQTLYKALRKFERIYVPWKMDDRDKLLEKFSQMYWEYDTHPDPDKQEECLKIMKKIDNLTFFNLFSA